MKIANIQLENLPGYIGVIPEVVNEKERLIRFHLYIMDGPINRFPSVTLMWDGGKNVLVSPEVIAGTTTYYTNQIPSFSQTKQLVKPIKKLLIEKNFFQSCKDKTKLPADVSMRMDFNKNMNPDFTYCLYDDNDMYRIYSDEMVVPGGEFSDLARRTYEATKVLVPGAFKADLFRYYLLYTRGGVWLDDKSVLRLPIDDQFFALDIYDGFMIFGSTVGVVEIAFMASYRKNPLILKFLTRALENIEGRKYGDGWLSITGPGIARDILREKFGELYSSKKILHIEEDNKNIRMFHVGLPTLYRGTEIVWTQFPHRPSFVEHVTKENYYARLWIKGNIYVDDNSNKEFCTTDILCRYEFVVICILLIVFACIAAYFLIVPT